MRNGELCTGARSRRCGQEQMLQSSQLPDTHRTGTGIFFTMYSHTASMLYLSCAEMGTTGAPSAMVPCSAPQKPLCRTICERPHVGSSAAVVPGVYQASYCTLSSQPCSCAAGTQSNIDVYRLHPHCTAGWGDPHLDE